MSPMDEKNTPGPTSQPPGARSAGSHARWKSKVAGKREPAPRKCPDCGVFVVSRVLLQCPICMGVLPEPPETSEPEETYLLVDGKLTKETEVKLLPDEWKFKEALGLFLNCIIAFTVTLFIATSIVLFQVNKVDDQDVVSIGSLVANQVPGIVFGLVPVFYIVAHGHKFSKLGFKEHKRAWDALAGLLLGLVALYLFKAGVWLNSLLVDAGVTWLAPGAFDPTFLVEAPAWQKLAVFLTMTFATLGEEVVFRGVFLQGLEVKLVDSRGKSRLELVGKGDAGKGRMSRIRGIQVASLLVAGTYAGFYALFTLSLAYVLANFIVQYALSLAFVSRGNSLNVTFAAQVLFSLLSFLDLMGIIAI
ncbi:MAG: hypothetical protein ACTSU5_16200 [Promethearchaeota archaeon]